MKSTEYARLQMLSLEMLCAPIKKKKKTNLQKIWAALYSS